MAKKKEDEKSELGIDIAEKIFPLPKKRITAAPKSVIKMTIDKFLESNYVDLVPLHKLALKRQYLGKILSQVEWNEIIKSELTKRV